MGETQEHHLKYHGNTHAEDGDDEITQSLKSEAYPQLYGLEADKPSAGVEGRTYWSTDENKLWLDDGSSWSDITDSDDFLPIDGGTMSGNIDMGANSITDLDYIDMETSPVDASHQEGRLQWHSTDKTLNVDTDVDGVTLQVGQEMFARVYNDTGSQLDNGEIVYIDGGYDGYPTVSLAQADDKTSSQRVMGMVTDNIADEAVGYICVYGRVRNLDTSSYSLGDGLFLSPTTPGALTTTEPSGTNHRIRVGYVIKVDASEGIILFDRNPLYNAEDIKMNHIEPASYQNIQQWINTHSAGYISGGTITDNGDGSVTVASGSGVIKPSDNELAESYFFDWSEDTNVSLTDNVTNWVYVRYNSGSPDVLATDDYSSIGGHDEYILGRVYRNGTELYIFNAGQTINDYVAKDCKKEFEIYVAQRADGLIIGKTGTRNITVTSGIYWCGHTRATSTSYDTSDTDTFTYIYRDGAGGWTESSGETQISNQYYDDGSGTLATVSLNNYGVHWIYLTFDDELYVQYGQDNYNKLSDAEEATVPSAPDYLDNFSFLLGRIIIERNATTFDRIESAFDETFRTTPITDHGDLGGLGDVSDHPGYLTLSGSRTMTGDLEMGGYNIEDVSSIDGGGSGIEIDDNLDLTGQDTLYTVTEKTVDYTASIGEKVLCDTSSGDVTITLPSPVSGCRIDIKKVSSDSNTLTISGDGNDVDGGSGIEFTNQYTSYTVSSDGTGWYII